MSGKFEPDNKICKVNNDEEIIRNDNASIVKYEVKDNALICDKCTLLKTLKEAVTNIYNTTIKNTPNEIETRQEINNGHFCEFDIINNLYKNCDNCRKLKSETSVQSAHRRKKLKQKISRSGSQIDGRLKNSLTASNLDQNVETSRKSRSLSRNPNTSVNLSESSKEEVLKWKQEIETLEIKRQIFTAVGQNKPKEFRTSRNKDKQAKKIETTQNFNFGDHTTEDRLVLIRKESPKVKDNNSKKEVEELDAKIKCKPHRSSRKKRNNSPVIQNDVEMDNKNLPVLEALINFGNSETKENSFPKLLNSNGEILKKDRKEKAKKSAENEALNNEKVDSKEIIDVFKKKYKTDKGTKSKRIHKDRKDKLILKKHINKDEDNEKMCPRHSKSIRKVATPKISSSSTKMPLLFGADYLINSHALKEDIEANKKRNKETVNARISEDVRFRDRKEISFSNLNLSPIIDDYAKNKAVIDSIFDQARKKRNFKDTASPRSRLSDEFSILSEAVTNKEKYSIRRQRQDRVKHYFGTQAKTSKLKLINQTTNHLISDENLIEVSTKILANDLIKSSVEGIEPPRKIMNKTFHRKNNSTYIKKNSLLHMTFLEPVRIPGVIETSPKLELCPIDNKIEVKTKDVLPIKTNSLKLPSSTERKSKISVLYEHSSNLARRKELRNKICKPNVAGNKTKPEDKLNSIKKISTNPDLTRRVSFARQKCTKCHGTKNAIKSTILTNKNDKGISVNMSGDAEKKDKKLTKKKSSKKMCTIDTQTDLIEFKNGSMADNVSQTKKVRNVTKQCSPIIIAVPGIHKSEVNVSKKEASKELKSSTYQKLQSAVLSLFENAKMTYEEEMDAITETVIKTNISNDQKKVIKSTKNIVPKIVPPPSVEVYSVRTKCNNERSGIPKLCKEKTLRKPEVTPDSSSSKLMDLKGLQNCIVDLISALNGIKIKQPEIAEKKDEKNEIIKDIPLEVRPVLSLQINESQIKRRQEINNVLSSTSVDSNRNALSYKTKSRQLRKLNNRRKKRKSSHKHVGDDNKELKSVFKNRNCYGSSSVTQVSSTTSEFAKENNFSNDCRKNILPTNNFNFKKPLGMDDSGALLMQQAATIDNQVKNKLLGLYPEVPSPKKVQAPTSKDYKNVMEQLVYMFSQKPLPIKKEESVVTTTSSNFSNDSLEKYDTNKHMPPKNCDFYVYATTIELDDKDVKKNLKNIDEENRSKKTFTSFSHQNKLNNNINISSSSSRNVFSHTSAGRKTVSLKNFFRKGGSLLDLFKNKNSTKGCPDSSSKCDTISELSSQTKIETLDPNPVAQYWFSICPQKEKSLETVHEGVQASAGTTDTSTMMRTWRDIGVNKSNQTKNSCQSQQSCRDHKCDHNRCNKSIKQDEKLRKDKKIEEELEKSKQILRDESVDTADFILDILLNNVLDKITEQEKNDKIEPKNKPSIELTKLTSLVRFNKESSNHSLITIASTTPTVVLKEILKKDKTTPTSKADMPTKFQSSASQEDNVRGDQTPTPKPDLPTKNLISASKEDNVKRDQNSTLKEDKTPTSKENIVTDASTLKSRDDILKEKLNSLMNSEEDPNLDEVDKIISSISVEDVAIDQKKFANLRSTSAEAYETSTKSSLKQPDEIMTNKKITVATSFSEKEVFEKMLNAYDREDSLVERLSNDDQFFNKEVESIRSDTEMENANSVPSYEDIMAEKPQKHNNTETNVEKAPRKMNKLRKLFGGHHKHANVKQIMPESNEDNAIRAKNESVNTIATADIELLRTAPELQAPPKQGQSRTKDMRFVQDDHSRHQSLTPKKKTDCSPVDAEDIGTCFARGFRPDNLALSGDACFNFNKQDKHVLTPSQEEGSIIDFSERQTPLDYLLALGFMVDEASNALKDEDIRSRLLAAITEARVWINKITTTQGTLLYLVSYKTHPKTMRYFLQLVEAIINNRINNAVKLNGFLKVLERVEEGELQMIDLLGADKFEDEENEEKIVRKQLRQLFATVYRIADKEARSMNKSLTKHSLILLRVLAAKYRAGLHPHLELIARYIGQNLIKTEIQLEAAMIYLSRLDTAAVKLKEFEAYCAIRCDEEDDNNANDM